MCKKMSDVFHKDCAKTCEICGNWLEIEIDKWKFGKIINSLSK